MRSGTYTCTLRGMGRNFKKGLPTGSPPIWEFTGSMVPCEDFLQGVPVPKGCPPPTTKCLSFHSSEPGCVSPTPVICSQIKNVAETAKLPGLEINTRCKPLNLGRKHFRLKPQWTGSQGKTSFPRQEGQSGSQTSGQPGSLSLVLKTDTHESLRNGRSEKL